MGNDDLEMNLILMTSNFISSALGIISFIYVALPIVFIVGLGVYYLFGKTISSEAWDKLGEFSKWYIVSVALVFAGNMIKDGFTERETGIKEMQVYDKYVDLILEADNIEKRWKLTEYFAVVTPTERLRERWVAYQDSIRDDYNNFLEISSEENIDEKDQKLSSYQTPLVSKPLNQFRVDLFYLEETQTQSLQKAQVLKEILSNYDYEVRVRKLSISTNQHSGYQITSNQIRAESSELSEAHYLKSILGEEDFEVRPIAFKTPNYISVFIYN